MRFDDLGRPAPDRHRRRRGLRSANVASMSSRRGARGHLCLDLGGDGVGRRLGPGDQPRQTTGAVLRLQDDVDGGELGIGRVVGDDHDLRRAGERGRNADDAGDLALGQRHVHVARADDDVDRAH